MSSVPGPPHFSELQQRVLDFGFADGKYRAAVKTWLNEGQDYFVLQTDFRTQFQTITFETSVYNNSLPNDYARLIETANATDENNWAVLEPLDLHEFDTLPVTYGTPDSYVIAGQIFYLYPYPDSEQTISLTYYRLPTAMVNDDDELDIPYTYAHIPISYALKRAFERESDYEAAAYWENELQAKIAKASGEAHYDTADGPTQVAGMWSQPTRPLWRLP